MESIQNKISGFKTKLSTHPTFQNSSEATVSLHFKRLQRWSKLRLSIAGPFAGLLEPIQTCFIQSLLLVVSLLLFIEAYWVMVCGLIYIGRPILYMLCSLKPSTHQLFLALWFASDVFLMKCVSKTKFSNESVFKLSVAFQLFAGWIISEILFLPVLFTSIFNPYIIWRNRKYRIIAETKAVPIAKKWWHQWWSQRCLYHEGLDQSVNSSLLTEWPDFDLWNGPIDINATILMNMHCLISNKTLPDMTLNYKAVNKLGVIEHFEFEYRF